MYLMVFKKLSVNTKTDDPPPPIEWYTGSNFKISNEKVHLATYLWKSLIKTKIPRNVILLCDNYEKN